MKLYNDDPIIGVQGKTFHQALRFSHQAMATVFEIFIDHDDAQYAQQAAMEAWRELDRLELELSRFIENSDISRINNLRQDQSIQIGMDTYECLKRCAHLTTATNGAFDVLIGYLMKNGGTGDAESSIDQSMDSSKQNMGLVLSLDEVNFRVTLLSNSISIDLGGFGKGYAIDRMAELLREWEIPSALIHGGASSVLALAAPSGETGWPITLSHPQSNRTMVHMNLKDRALSGSGSRKGFHIIDPRTKRAVERRLAAWAFSSDGATSDALSTAFMAMSPEEIEAYCSRYPETQGMIIIEDKRGNEKEGQVLAFGNWE